MVPGVSENFTVRPGTKVRPVSLSSTSTSIFRSQRCGSRAACDTRKPWVIEQFFLPDPSAEPAPHILRHSEDIHPAIFGLVGIAGRDPARAVAVALGLLVGEQVLCDGDFHQGKSGIEQADIESL